MMNRFHNRLVEAWRVSDRIFDVVARDRWLHRPIKLRHPILFYVGHLPAFAWNQLGNGLLGLGPFHREFDSLFERGIDPVGTDGHSPSVEWPAIDLVLAYRDSVRARLLEVIGEVCDHQNGDVMAVRGRIHNVILEHEYMHQETLQYMLQRMDPRELLRPENTPDPVTGRRVAHESVEIAGGTAKLGADFDSVDFGWDNEFPSLGVRVEPFAIDRFPVQIGEWWDFLDAGGYLNQELWTPADWKWRQKIGLDHPANWELNGREWRCRTVFDRCALTRVAGWPVMVSNAEARAYCRWKGTRLPTEAELHFAMYGGPGATYLVFPWGDAEPVPGVHGNFDFVSWAPTPVDAHPAGASAWGVEDTVGNTWEWTSSPFAPFPGFDAYISSYPGYSADFFDDRHFVMLGASWATPKPLIRRSFRNWFQDQYPFVFAGFRTVRPL